MDDTAFRLSAPFSGSPRRALDQGVAVLAAVGFRAERVSESSVEMVGPGMRTSRQSPLTGASRLTLSARSGSLDLEADLSACVRLQRFVRWFPPLLVGGLGVFLTVMFAASLGVARWRAWVPAIAGGAGVNFLVWVVLGPLIARLLERRVKRSLGDFLQHVATYTQAT